MAIPLTLLLISTATAAPPAQHEVTTVLGPKAYRDGDVIEITDVTATSSRLEHGDSVTVRGRVHLKSRDKAELCLYLTTSVTSGSGDVAPPQRTMVSKGQSEFELKTTIRNRGALHLTFYDLETGDAIGGTYFGTTEQMKDIADWDVSYYLTDDDPQARSPQSFQDPTLLWLHGSAARQSARLKAKVYRDLLDFLTNEENADN